MSPEVTTPKIKFMGLQVKRNDAAMVLKVIYSALIRILVLDLDTPEYREALAKDPNLNSKRFFVRRAQDYARQEAKRLLDGGYSLRHFTLSKALRGYYKNPDSIKHKQLAMRANARGTDMFQSNDRCVSMLNFLSCPNIKTHD